MGRKGEAKKMWVLRYTFSAQSHAYSFVQEEGEEFKEGETAVQDEPMGEESQATTTGNHPLVPSVDSHCLDAGDEPMEEGGGGEGGGEEEDEEEDSDSEGEDGVNVIIDQKRIEEDKTKTIQSMQVDIRTLSF